MKHIIEEVKENKTFAVLFLILVGVFVFMTLMALVDNVTPDDKDNGTPATEVIGEVQIDVLMDEDKIKSFMRTCKFGGGDFVYMVTEEEVSFKCNQNFDQDFIKDIEDAPEVKA